MRTNTAETRAFLQAIIDNPEADEFEGRSPEHIAAMAKVAADHFQSMVEIDQMLDQMKAEIAAIEQFRPEALA